MSNTQSTTAAVQKATAGKFNRSPIVFDESCGLSATSQMAFRRLFSQLCDDDTHLWQGSYTTLAALCRIAVSAAHDTLQLLIKAGLVTCKKLATGKKTGNTGTLQIHLSTDRLWRLNERYSQLTESQREEFCQRYAWKTLDELERSLSIVERDHTTMGREEEGERL